MGGIPGINHPQMIGLFLGFPHYSWFQISLTSKMSGHAVSFAGTHEVSESHFTIYIYMCVCVYVGWIYIYTYMWMYDNVWYIYIHIYICVCVIVYVYVCAFCNLWTIKSAAMKSCNPWYFSRKYCGGAPQIFHGGLKFYHPFNADWTRKSRKSTKSH